MRYWLTPEQFRVLRRADAISCGVKFGEGEYHVVLDKVLNYTQLEFTGTVYNTRQSWPITVIIEEVNREVCVWNHHRTSNMEGEEVDTIWSIVYKALILLVRDLDPLAKNVEQITSYVIPSDLEWDL